MNNIKKTEIKIEIKDVNKTANEFKKDKNCIKSQSKKRFDVDLICRAFEEFNRNDRLSLDHYINGYKELAK